jgi:DNA-directed RNA polymerase specialized sigma24 family protein
VVTLDRDDHGFRACYLAGCRCDLCSQAQRRYCKTWSVTTHQHGKLRVESTPVADQVRAWRAEGWSYRQIAIAAGVSHARISALSRDVYPTIHRDLARKILNCRPTIAVAPSATCVDATGSRRRLQALAAIGHTFTSIGRAIGLTPTAIGRISLGQRPNVLAGTAQDITALYRSWCQQPGPSQAARSRARREGWPGPLAWGDNIDAPDATPDADINEAVLTRDELATERLAEMWLLASAGTLPPQIAERTGIPEKTIRDRLRRKYPQLYLELTA